MLRPGGLLHGYVPCEGQPPTLHWLLGRWVQRWTARHAGHVAHFRHAEVVALAEGAGFAIVGVQYSYHLLGQALDVATFAAREAVFRRRGGGQARPEAYYDRSVLGGGGLGGSTGRCAGRGGGGLRRGAAAGLVPVGAGVAFDGAAEVAPSAGGEFEAD